MPVSLTARHADDDHGDEARIEVVPLIDIMFFLLASFMMVSLSMTRLHRVPVNVPQAATATQQTKAPPFQIAIDSAGVVTWDAKAVTLTEITDRLKKQPVPDETRVLISADGDSRHKIVLQVLDAVRAAGIKKVGFEAKKGHE